MLRTRKYNHVCAACFAQFSVSLLVAAPALATEYGFGDYGLGYGIPMSGYTPPPGVYFSDTFYLYSASATTNGNFPFGNITAAGVKVNFTTNIAATAWYTDVKIFGGTLGFAAAIPDRRRHEFRSGIFHWPLGVQSPAQPDGFGSLHRR